MSAGLGGIFGRLTGNDTINQILIYNIVGGIVAGALTPLSTELIQEINSKFPNVALSPAEAASAVVRGFMDNGQGAQEASYSAIDTARFNTLVRLAGQSLGPGDLATALRRGIIPEDAGNPDGVGFVQGIAQGNLANKWAAVVKQLATSWPTPNDALDAYLEGQIDEGTAKDLYEKFGGDLQYFQMLFDTRGNAPTPTQALDLLNRGIITESGQGPDSTSYEQAFLEGPWRNKWLKPFEELRWYLTPPRTTTAMYNEGSIDKETATKWLQMYGVPDENIPAFLPDKTQDPAGPTRSLARSQVETAYTDLLIDRATAEAMLVSLGYTQSDADFILNIDDFKIVHQNYNTVLSRLKSLYLSGKIDKQFVSSSLNALGMSQEQIQANQTSWDLVKVEQVRDLTASQVVNAVYYQFMSTQQGLDYLTSMGYSDRDAWILIALKYKGPIPDRPEPPPDQFGG